MHIARATIFMAASWTPPPQVAVLWDVDGTLVESTKLAFDATNEVLVGAGLEPVSVDEYKIGCRYTTPERFNYHLGKETGDAAGARLGQIFDETYVARVSKDTAGLFDGMDGLLRSLSMNGHPQGALSNACGAYVRAVMTANELDEVPGQRLAIMKIAKGADEVARAKPHPDGLVACCAELGVEPAVSVRAWARARLNARASAALIAWRPRVDGYGL